MTACEFLSKGLSRSNILIKRSKKGRGDVKVISNSRALTSLVSRRMKYFFWMEKRKEDYSMNEDRTLKDGLSSCSNLPANITQVTARTTASGALLPTIAWLTIYLSAMLMARYNVSGLYCYRKCNFSIRSTIPRLYLAVINRLLYFYPV